MTVERRIDPATGATLILGVDGLIVVRSDGSRGFIPAPEGFSLSHFGDGATVIGRGEAPIDGWRDWHFQPDVEACVLRRLGPAY